MYKKTLTYTNYNGEEITEDLYFHLNQRDLIKITAKFAKGIKNAKDVDLTIISQQILQEGDWPRVVELLEDCILGAYGVRTPDGQQFIKSKEVRDNFEYSIAYAEMFDQMLSDPKEMQAFMKNVVDSKSSNSNVTAVLS